jgi:dTDP-4-dehydrorhamnose reductase
MKVLILGGDGMLGHELMRSLAPVHEVHVTLRQPLGAYGQFRLFSPDAAVGEVDVRNWRRVETVVRECAPQVVVNGVGLVKQRADAKSPLLAVQVNSLFPHQLRALCEDVGARLIHFSTDCVFSGHTGGYRETDTPDPMDLYGRSKLLGEVSDPPGITLRTSIIGLELWHRTGLIEWFLAQRGTVRGYRRAIYTGLTTCEISRLVARIIERHPALHGVWHVASESITKYDLLVRLSRALGRTDVEIVPDDEFACDRSLRAEAFRTATGYVPPSWDDMLAELADEVRQRNRGRTA